MAVSVLFSLVAGLRINFLYTTLIDSAIKVKLNVAEARREFLKNDNEPTSETLQRAWGYLEIAEFNSQILFEEKGKLSFLNLPINDVKLQEEVQKLQVILVDYRDLSSKLSKGTGQSSRSVSKQEWEKKFDAINSQSEKVQFELRKILDAQIKNFKLTQFILIGVTLIMSFLSVFVFYRYERQRAMYMKRLQDASTTIEKRTRKTTMTEEALLETQRRLTTLVNN